MSNFIGSRFNRRSNRPKQTVSHQRDVETVVSHNGVVHRLGASLSGHGNVLTPPTKSETKADLMAAIDRSKK